jgi:Domain of unknown function (DUF6894)
VTALSKPHETLIEPASASPSGRDTLVFQCTCHFSYKQPIQYQSPPTGCILRRNSDVGKWQAYGFRLAWNAKKAAAFFFHQGERLMPKYYIHLEPHGFSDEEGEELAGPEAAKQFAERVAQDLTRNRHEELPYQRLFVTDERGQVVHERPLVLH